MGLDALSPLLEHVTFPATKEDVIARIGDLQVPIDKESTSTVRTIVAQVTPESFQSSAALEDAVKARWDDIAMREGRGGRHRQSDNLEERPR